MATDCFSLNTEILFSKSPELKEAFAAFAPNDFFEIIPTSSGSPSARYKGLTVHSRHDPVREAETLIAKEIPEGVSICLIYGFGLGYLAESFITKFPHVPCVIIEPDVSCFLKALCSRDLRPVLDHPQSVFFLSVESAPIIRYLDAQELSAVHIVKLRSLYEKDRDYYERTDALIQSFLRQREVNSATLRRFGKLWVRNLLKNMKLLASSPGVKLMKNAFEGVPALVCAGGPSLEAILPHLSVLRERMLVIAVDTTMAILQRSGVDPDITVICDPQYWNTRHLDRVRNSSSIIISESSTHPRVFRKAGGNVFFASSVFPLGQYLESLTGEKGKLGAGGSVATTAWDGARFLGCHPIIMAGLDLGFPGKKTHFRGAYFEDLFYCSSRRLLPHETSAFAYLQEAHPFPVASNAGGFVLSDHRMAVYKFWFETQLRLTTPDTTFNLSEHGVKIEGMPFISFDRLGELPAKRNLIDSTLTRLRSLPGSGRDPAAVQQILHDGLEKLIHELDGLAATAFDGIKICRLLQTKSNNREDLSSLLKKLDAIDRRIETLSSKHIASFLIQPLIKEIFDATGKGKKPDDSLDYSVRLYNELESSARYHAALLRKSISLLQ